MSRFALQGNWSEKGTNDSFTFLLTGGEGFLKYGFSCRVWVDVDVGVGVGVGVGGTDGLDGTVNAAAGTSKESKADTAVHTTATDGGADTARAATNAAAVLADTSIDATSTTSTSTTDQTTGQAPRTSILGTGTSSHTPRASDVAKQSESKLLCFCIVSEYPW